MVEAETTAIYSQLAESPHRPLIRVPLGHEEKSYQVQNTEDGQEEEEVMEVTTIQIVRYPSRLPTSSTHICNYGHKQWAQVISKGHSGERESRAEAPHGVRSLLIEEL